MSHRSKTPSLRSLLSLALHGGVASMAFGALAGCSSSEELAGQSCEVAADCYSGVDRAALSGEVVCLDRVEDGYCTHECETDDDCCAVDGECRTDAQQVCAPFESDGRTMCFVSCEAEDLRDEDGKLDPSVDDTDFCQRYAHRDAVCRSTGGGSANRKVCVPGG